MTTYNLSYQGDSFINDNGTWYEVSGETWFEIEDWDFCAELDGKLTSGSNDALVPDDTGRRCACEDFPCCGCYS